jgi:REP element-mobilizing transposase RayT
MAAEIPNARPIYTSENIEVAFQLDWSLTIFWRESLWTDDWFESLRRVLESDGIRLLKHRFPEPQISLFLVSTKPDVVPFDIPRRVKGRLQHLLRDRIKKPFQRNYDLRSVGSTTREKLEGYLGSQLEHHPERDRNLRWMLSDMQVIRPDTDLAQPRFTAHGRFWSNLHLVIVNDRRCRETCQKHIGLVRKMMIQAAEKKQHLLSRIAILPDHVHLLLGTHLEESPLSIGLSYMNNIAYVYKMQPVLKAGCFLGGFGEYDLGAIE